MAQPDVSGVTVSDSTIVGADKDNFTGSATRTFVPSYDQDSSIFMVRGQPLVKCVPVKQVNLEEGLLAESLLSRMSQWIIGISM